MKGNSRTVLPEDYRKILEELNHWLLDPENRLSAEEIFEYLINRIADMGCPLSRAATSLVAKHPEVFGVQLIWARGEPIRRRLIPHTMAQTKVYLESPVFKVRQDNQKIRVRLDGPAEELPFEICRELKEAGDLDYLVLPVNMRRGMRTYVSCSTKRADGFRDAEIEFFEKLIPAFSLRMELEMSEFAANSLLETYLGANAAGQVAGGKFKRGQGEELEAVIFTCDLRGFTAMVDSHDRNEVIAALDQYFASVADPIMENGGEVLKFIGDAILAVFITGDERRAVCERAVSAVARASEKLSEINAERKSSGLFELQFGGALHFGRVLYGNIGSQKRLDFTVIGSAVNEVCRIESMCKVLKKDLLLSAAFVREWEPDRARSEGRHNLKGVEEAMELFSIA